jgi:mitogen-activated protein kinase kinase 3
LAYDELDMGDIIGRGSSSIVLHAVHAPTSTPLALKIINLFDKSKRDQLIREIATLYDAQCPNLITFYGAFYRDGAITIALEYMDGGSLANVLDQVGPIPEQVLAGMAYQILWGLAYLKHEKRVHRDVKPSNLLINSSGEVKVGKF